MRRVIPPFIWSMLASAPLCLTNANKWVKNGWMQTFFLWTTKHVFVHFYLQPPHTWIHQQEHKVLHIMWSRCTATVYCVVTQCQSTPTCLLCKMFVSTALKLWLWGIKFIFYHLSCISWLLSSYFCSIWQIIEIKRNFKLLFVTMQRDSISNDSQMLPTFLIQFTGQNWCRLLSLLMHWATTLPGSWTKEEWQFPS